MNFNHEDNERFNALAPRGYYEAYLLIKKSVQKILDSKLPGKVILNDLTPPNYEYVTQCMDALYELLEKENHTGVRAVLGHFIFVYIHPYMDGNGRIRRFLMNVMLASGGYPWTIIHVATRDKYIPIMNEELA